MIKHIGINFEVWRERNRQTLNNIFLALKFKVRF